jgi:hypothetical protein
MKGLGGNVLNLPFPGSRYRCWNVTCSLIPATKSEKAWAQLLNQSVSTTALRTFTASYYSLFYTTVMFDEHKI